LNFWKIKFETAKLHFILFYFILFGKQVPNISHIGLYSRLCWDLL
jgi:hypothetical protein